MWLCRPGLCLVWEQELLWLYDYDLTRFILHNCVCRACWVLCLRERGTSLSFAQDALGFLVFVCLSIYTFSNQAT